jgi:hypothetical protein
VAEILLGATTVSRLGGLMPLIFFYGGGAVIIRELARRRGPGWGRILVLAAAYGVVEEGLIIQSMFNPDLFKAGLLGGRALGVNWVWSEWTVGYHAVYSITIPVLLAELLFPSRRAEPWLGGKGLTVVGALYVLSALAVGMAFRRLIAPDFRTPPAQAVGAALCAVALVVLALRWPDMPRARRPEPDARGAPSPWVVGLLAFLAAAAWFQLLALPEALKTGTLVLVPMLSGVALAAGVAAMLRRWSDREEGWTDLHRLALVFGALPPVMLFGFFVVTAGNRVDQVGQGVASAVAVGLLTAFALRLRQRVCDREAARPHPLMALQGADPGGPGLDPPPRGG